MLLQQILDSCREKINSFPDYSPKRGGSGRLTVLLNSTTVFGIFGTTKIVHAQLLMGILNGKVCACAVFVAPWLLFQRSRKLLVIGARKVASFKPACINFSKLNDFWVNLELLACQLVATT